MDLIYIGKLVNTHGLEGEVRIISDFKYKDLVFKSGNEIIINDNKYTIRSYRCHKMYDMITIENINTIDDALNLKGLNVYVDRNSYKFDGYLDEDLVGLSVYDNDIYKGKVVEILKTDLYTVLVIDGIKRHMVPNISEFIKKIDLENNKVNINYIEGLDNED